jgi:hypothetical protein
VRDFLESFEVKLESVPVIEKKEVIQMIVDKIVVDREAGEVNCYIKALPGIAEIEQLKGSNNWVSGVAPKQFQAD